MKLTFKNPLKDHCNYLSMIVTWGFGCVYLNIDCTSNFKETVPDDSY